MKFSNLEKADRARRALDRASEDQQALGGKFLMGILIGSRKDDPSPIVLQTAGTCGTGTISGIGYPDSLRIMLEDALHAWCQRRIDDAQKELVALGVDLVA